MFVRFLTAMRSACFVFLSAFLPIKYYYYYYYDYYYCYYYFIS